MRLGPALRRATVVLAGLAPFLLALVAPTGATAQVSCGQVVTESVTLEADLICPVTVASGLVVGADGITIDLNGHSIRGEFPGYPWTGIDNRAGHDRVTVRDGEIFASTAIHLDGASETLLVDLGVSSRLGAGVHVEGGNRNTITRSHIRSGFSAAIFATGAKRIRIVKNSVYGYAVVGPAIRVESRRGLIAGNAIEPGSGGISVAGDRNRIARNVVTEAFESAIRVPAGSGNVVVRNSVVDTRAFSEGDDSSGDGIFVAAATSDTVLRRNVVVGGAGDGIDVESAATRLVRNLADDNGDLGIESVPGVVGVGNRASGNGNPLQCLNVVCD